MIAAVQFWVFLILLYAAFVVELWALGDCAIRAASAFKAAGKWPKPVWLAILAGAAVLGFLALPPFGPLQGLFALLIMGFAIFYLVDVRPAVRRYGPRRGPGSGRSGGW